MPIGRAIERSQGWHRRLTVPQFTVVTGLLVVLIGTLLLATPLCSSSRVGLWEALFTATSAITVTGLSIIDIGTDLTTFGQAVLALMILAPMAAGLVQMAISRSREYEADRVGAEIANDPHALASALQKIEAYAKRIHNPTAERNPASGQLFIINPLAGRGADNLFSTHPATGNRVRALVELGAKMGMRPRQAAPASAPAVPISAVPATHRRLTTGVPATPAEPRGPWGWASRRAFWICTSVEDSVR